MSEIHLFDLEGRMWTTTFDPETVDPDSVVHCDCGDKSGEPCPVWYAATDHHGHLMRRFFPGV